MNLWIFLGVAIASLIAIALHNLLWRADSLKSLPQYMTAYAFYAISGGATTFAFHHFFRFGWEVGNIHVVSAGIGYAIGYFIAGGLLDSISS